MYPRDGVSWKRIAFWATIFYFVYTWPTEGQGRPRYRTEVVAKMPKDPPPITLDVMPPFVIPNPFKRQTFRVRWRIEPHPDNRHFRFESECENGESIASERETDQITWVIYPELRGGPCHFRICVIRTTGKRVCADREVLAPEGDGR